MKKIVKLVLFLIISIICINLAYAFDISIQTPANNTIIGPIITSGYPNITVEVNISSAVNVTLVNITISGTEICSNNSINLTNYTCIWNVSETGDGIYILNAEATNSSGQTSTNLTQNITIDSTVSSITLNNPSDSLITSNNTINFNWTASDNLANTLNCNLTIDDTWTTNINSSNGTAVNYSQGNFANGTHYWNVTCEDEAKNSVTSETYSFTIDTIVPSLYLVAPANATSSTTSNPTLQWNVTDNIDTSLTCTVFINGGSIGSVSSTNSSITSLTASNLVIGTNYWNVTCTDDAGNSNSSNETWIYTLLASGGGGGGSSYYYNTAEVETRKISPTTGGYAAIIYTYETPQLQLDSLLYDLRLSRILYNSVDLKIGDIFTTLEKDKETNIDLNRDLQDDLSVKLTDISFNKANIIFTKLVTKTIPKIKEPEPIEEELEIEEKEEPEKPSIQEKIEQMPPNERSGILLKSILLVVGIVAVIAFLMWPESVKKFFKK